jgi:hypothetical protein
MSKIHLQESLFVTRNGTELPLTDLGESYLGHGEREQVWGIRDSVLDDLSARSYKSGHKDGVKSGLKIGIIVTAIISAGVSIANYIRRRKKKREQSR